MFRMLKQSREKREDDLKKDTEQLKGENDLEKKYSFIPFNVLSFDEYEIYRGVKELEEHTFELLDVFSQIINNIIYSETPENKNDLIREVTREFMTRLDDINSLMEGEKKRVPIVPQSLKGIEDSFPLLYKDESGTWHWIGIYSNNATDREGDILTSESHKDFVRAVESGEWPYPVLEYWHSNFPVGKSYMVYYDESTGMSIAAGLFFKEYADLAEVISSTQTFVGMSHGVPVDELVRSNENYNHIERYRCKEFSFLPNDFAANFLTIFNDEKVKKEMTLTLKEKLEKIEGMSPEVVNNILKQAKKNKEFIDVTGIVTKQTEEVDVAEIAETPEVSADNIQQQVDTPQKQEEPEESKEFGNGLLDDEEKELLVKTLGYLIQSNQELRNELDELAKLVKENKKTESRPTLHELKSLLPFGTGANNTVTADDPLVKSEPKTQNKYGSHELASLIGEY